MSGRGSALLSNFSLYAATVLIWGSTWLVIKFQLVVVPPMISVVWRFLLAALILLGYAVLKRLPLRFSLRDHLWMAAQGLLLFATNYVFIYVAEEYLASGLVALVFSLFVFFNIFGMRVFFAVPTKPSAVFGAVLGVAGVIMIFWPEVAKFSLSDNGLLGVAYALAATMVASLGNMVATRNQRHAIPIVQMNGWAMLYGSALVAIAAASAGQRFLFDWSLSYVVSLLYLSVFGSVLAFGAYLTLMGRIGAGRAGYTSVAIPVVALLLSTLFEDLRWQASMLIGVALCLAGNVLVLRRGKEREA